MFIYAFHACNKCTLFLPIKYVVKSLNNDELLAHRAHLFVVTILFTASYQATEILGFFFHQNMRLMVRPRTVHGLEQMLYSMFEF